MDCLTLEVFFFSSCFSGVVLQLYNYWKNIGKQLYGMMWSAVGLQTQPPAQSRLSCGVRHGGSGLWATGVRTPPRPEMVQAFQVACPSVQYPDMEIPETCFLQLKTLLFLLMATVAQKPQPPVTSLQAEQTPQSCPPPVQLCCLSSQCLLKSCIIYFSHLIYKSSHFVTDDHPSDQAPLSQAPSPPLCACTCPSVLVHRCFPQGLKMRHSGYSSICPSFRWVHLFYLGHLGPSPVPMVDQS